MEVAQPFLESLSPAERDALLTLGRAQTWTAGERMIRAGEPAEAVIVLLTGVVKIHVSGADGTETILNLLGPGDLLGEVAPLRDAVRSADVTALDDTDGLVIGVDRLRAFLAEHPQVTLALLDLALARLHLADRRRLESATSESLPRVASRIVELAQRFGAARDDGALELAIPLTQDELAAWSGASRESTARGLRTLRELGLIETRRRHLAVLDLTRLRAHAPSA